MRKLSGKGRLDTLDGMAHRWKGLFLGSPKKAMTYHLITAEQRAITVTGEEDILAKIGNLLTNHLLSI